MFHIHQRLSIGPQAFTADGGRRSFGRHDQAGAGRRLLFDKLPGTPSIQVTHERMIGPFRVTLGAAGGNRTRDIQLGKLTFYL